MGLRDRIRELFAEDESWKRKEPRRHDGKVYGAWVPEEDKRAAWPNATCAKCGGVKLKKEMYWNREADSWLHRECMNG